MRQVGWWLVVVPAVVFLFALVVVVVVFMQALTIMERIDRDLEALNGKGE